MTREGRGEREDVMLKRVSFALSAPSAPSAPFAGSDIEAVSEFLFDTDSRWQVRVRHID